MSKLVQLKDTDGNVYPRTTIGKLLWSGNFTSGTINVPNLSKYTCIAVRVGSVLCFGHKFYGIGGFGRYGDNTIGTYAYRFLCSGNTLSTNQYDLGGYDDNGNRAAITDIWGIF